MRPAEIEENGFGVIGGALDAETIDALRVDLSNLNLARAVGRKNEAVYGVRDLLHASAAARELAASAGVQGIAAKFLGPGARVVRAIFFDKTPEANWKVPWHQDLTIAVKERRAAEGFSAWTTKAGVPHVQPPVRILEKMLTLRFHLDDTDETNGALKVIPRSHRSGRLGAAEIKSWREANETHVCRVKKGDCLIMRPLILHSSSAGTSPRNRRVVHLEFAAEELPDGLDWYGS